MSARIPDPASEGRGEDTTDRGRPVPPHPPLTPSDLEHGAAEAAYRREFEAQPQAAGDAERRAEDATPAEAAPPSLLNTPYPQPPLTSPQHQQATAHDAYQHGLGNTQHPEGAHEAPRSGERSDAAAGTGGEHAAAGYAPPTGAYSPPAGGYAPPAGGYSPPSSGAAQAGASTVTLNYWLSVFFVWIPALIFYLTEKDKGDRLATDYHRENLNFSLLRTGVYLLTWIVVPFDLLGLLLGMVLGLASLVLFVLHIIAAVKAPDGYRRGAPPEFVFNIPLIR